MRERFVEMLLDTVLYGSPIVCTLMGIFGWLMGYQNIQEMIGG